MGFFGSGDKSTTSSDNRIGASDDAVIVQPGGFIFNPGRTLANDQLLDPATKPNWVVIGAAVAVVVLVLFLFTRK